MPDEGFADGTTPEQDTPDSTTKCTDNANGSIPGTCINIHGQTTHVDYLRAGFFVPQSETYSGHHRITKNGVQYRYESGVSTYTGGYGGTTFYWKWNINANFPDGTEFCASFKGTDGTYWGGFACADIQA